MSPAAARDAPGGLPPLGRFGKPARIALSIGLVGLAAYALRLIWCPALPPQSTEPGAASLGATFNTAIVEHRRELSWPEEAPGAEIASTVSGGPAYLAGLAPGDRIASFDGEPTPDDCALDALIEAREPGRRVKVEVRRRGAQAPETLTIELADGPVLYGKLCGEGQLDACTALAHHQIRGLGLAADRVAAEHNLERACAGGERFACSDLAGRLVNDPNPPALARGAELAKKACDAGVAPACSHLAFLYATARGVPGDDTRATGLYEQGCQGGDAPGCYNVGLMYEKQRGVTRNDARSLLGYVAGCEGGYPQACTNLGFLYDRGIGVVTNEERAAKLYERACDGRSCAAGDPLGCLNLGVFAREGRGLPKDEARAAKLFERACAASVAAGCNNLGILVETGQGTAPDVARAADLYRRACDLGSENGCNNAAAQAAERGARRGGRSRPAIPKRWS
ncbi:MAG TPA: PDZ domain-containing protein [Thermoanaerobaculia bacterium]|nr:PDZ domain-containing protein [Thermoanaerobaculia bacterium]